MFVHTVLGMEQRVWVACHLAAFELFAGVPARPVADNVKPGVIRPDLYEPEINRDYADPRDGRCALEPRERRCRDVERGSVALPTTKERRHRLTGGAH
jgi:transposase